jgi:hypothetical protein
MKKILRRLKAKVILLSVTREVNIDYPKDNDSIFEAIKISYSNIIAKNITNIEDTRYITREILIKLIK